MNPENHNITEAEWARRLAELREAEWKTRCKLQELGEKIVIRAAAAVDEQKSTVDSGIKFLELASKFGRQAVEGVEEPPHGEEVQEQWMNAFESALDALYSQQPSPEGRV